MKLMEIEYSKWTIWLLIDAEKKSDKGIAVYPTANLVNILLV